jgi:transposase
MTDKKFREFDRDQMFLLPPSVQEWLPEGHLAYLVVDVVDQLDLSSIYKSYRGDGRGQPPYDPRMMTALLLYAYCVGVPSSRQIEKRTHEDVAFRVLAANQHPDHDSICAFRKRHLKSLADLFLQVLQLCRRAGLVKLGHVALDGTKVKANASKHKAMSYGRMKKARKELEAEIWALLDTAERTDADEDDRFGAGNRGWDLPAEFSRRASRLTKIRDAMRSLEDEAVEAARAKQRSRQKKRSKGGGRKPPGRRPKVTDPEDAKPSDKAQRNFTDPDSRIMVDGSAKSFEQCYNGQAAVDDYCQVIVAAELTTEANDKHQVEPMVWAIEAGLGGLPAGLTLTADAGYFSAGNIELLEQAGLDPYVAPGKVRHGERVGSSRGRPPRGMTDKQRMSRKLGTKAGRKVYSRRKAVVEPVFGQIKQARGLRRFLLRGQENAAGEWKLICLTHNLLKLWRYGQIVPA